MSTRTVGFIGLGRMGLPLASLLVQAGNTVVAPARGRKDEFVEAGGSIAGDGTARAVAEAADVVCTSLPSARELDQVITGDDGILAAGGPAPTVIELSVVPIGEKARIRDLLVERGGDLLDCPVSGAPPMIAAKMGIIYASGDRDTYDKVADLVTAMAPSAAYVGPLGDGTKLKYVVNLLAMVNGAAVVETMAFADSLGLDLHMVAEIVSKSPGATSGQFNLRAPLIAGGKLDGALVTLETMCEVLGQIQATADEIDASVPTFSTVKNVYYEFAEQVPGHTDPAQMFNHLRQARQARAST